MYLTIFTGKEEPRMFNLEHFKEEQIWFGSFGNNNSIVLDSHIVSARHGFFQKKGDTWFIIDAHSMNGLYVNERQIHERMISDGLKVYIGSEGHSEQVVFLFTISSRADIYHCFLLGQKNCIQIGRKPENDICLHYVGVLGIHAQILKKDRDGYWLKRVGRSEIRYNGRKMDVKEQKMQDMDRFMIGDTHFLYRAGELIYYRLQNGMGLEASQLTRTVKTRAGEKTIVDHVDLQIQPGELAAIVGGSGAGKTSLLKCLSGCVEFTQGCVLIQGEDIRSGYESMKSLIGYVPQKDIVYEDLTLERMLYYSARLRMPGDASPDELKKRMETVIRMVELSGHEKTLIGRMSGGQKKRASIAVELLADPGIFFLDEPTSGLDPGTEKHLMETLKAMALEGMTVVLVTHTPLNIRLCDRVVFMGQGGRLCFSGSPDEALHFFGVENFTDIYEILDEKAEEWSSRFARQQAHLEAAEYTKKPEKRGRGASFFRQFAILSSRYVQIICGDKKKLLLQAAMAPVLGMLLYVAFSGALHPFEVAVDTQTFGLALACCSFWIGLFQSIQEVSKERVIMERERMADLKIGAYLASKISVLGVLLLLQNALLMTCVWLLIGHPGQGVVLEGAPFVEYLVTTYLTSFSAACMGLFVSAVAANTDQAVSISPFLLIPQILFSDIICGLSGAAERLSWLVGCRWACLAFGASAKINDLANEYGKTWLEASDASETTDFYYAKYDTAGGLFSLSSPVVKSWIVLFLLVVLFCGMTYAVLKKRREI